MKRFQEWLTEGAEKHEKSKKLQEGFIPDEVILENERILNVLNSHGYATNDMGRTWSNRVGLKATVNEAFWSHGETKGRGWQQLQNHLNSL